jgi:hypothetical protein
MDGEEMTDTWDGLLDAALVRLTPEDRARITPERREEIARNLEEALLAWPRDGEEAAVPVKAVKFLVMKPPVP